MKPTTRRRLLRIAYTLRWRLMDLIKFHSRAQVFLLVQLHTHTHTNAHTLVLHTYLRPTCILICPALRPPHTSAANGNNCSTHTHTHIEGTCEGTPTHTFIYTCMYLWAGYAPYPVLCSLAANELWRPLIAPS